MIETTELLEKLSQKGTEELEYAIQDLMLKGKIDFISIVKCYTSVLEIHRKDLKEQHHEALSASLDLLLCMKSRKDLSGFEHNAIHRALYNANISDQFNMHSLNDRYNYNEEDDKHLSYYYRKHHGES